MKNKQNSIYKQLEDIKKFVPYDPKKDTIDISNQQKSKTKKKKLFTQTKTTDLDNISKQEEQKILDSKEIKIVEEEKTPDEKNPDTEQEQEDEVQKDEEQDVNDFLDKQQVKLKQALKQYILDNNIKENITINRKNFDNNNALDFTLQVDIDLFKQYNETSNTPPGIENAGMNRCWNISFIQMLYNIIEYRNSLIFETPSINTDEILKQYNHLKSTEEPADLQKNDNPILIIAALKHIFKRLLRAELLNIPYISGFMEHKLFVDFGAPRCDVDRIKTYDSHNEINPMLLMFLTINNPEVEEHNNILAKIFNYSYIEHIKFKKYAEDGSVLENLFDKYIIKNYASENSQLINTIRLSNGSELNKIDKIKTHMFQNNFNETCSKKINYPLKLKDNFENHDYRNLTDCIKNYDKNININNNLHKYHFNKYDCIELNKNDYLSNDKLKPFLKNKTILAFNDNKIKKTILNSKTTKTIFESGILAEYNKYFVESPQYLLIEIIPNACDYKDGSVKERNTPINYKNISIPNLLYITSKTILTYEDNCSIIDNVLCDDYDIHSVILHQSHHFTFIKKNTNNKWIYYDDTVVLEINQKEAEDLINKKGSFFLYKHKQKNNNTNIPFIYDIEDTVKENENKDMDDEKDDTQSDFKGSLLNTIREIKVQSNDNRWDLLQYPILDNLNENDDITKYILEQKNLHENTDDIISFHFWKNIETASEKTVSYF